MSTQATTEAVVGIAKTLITHDSVRSAEWTALSLVACRRVDQDRAHRMYGYVYLDDGTTTDLELDFMALRGQYKDLISATVPEGEDGWHKCLLQLDKTGRSNLLFEQDDNDRWTSNPADLNELPASLRPEFDAPAAAIDGES